MNKFENIKKALDNAAEKEASLLDVPHGINPKGHRLLVLPDEVEVTTKSGIVIATGVQEFREQLAQVDGVVVAMGNTCYSDQPEPWCKVGDRIIFGKYSGIIREGKDGKKYRVINDLDCVATIEE
jgi:co-chaperonin GroES (HSP10)